MARMSIDDSAQRDPRVKRLGRMLHEKFGDDVSEWPDFARRYALGTLLDVWNLPYDRVTPTVPEKDIDEVALIDYFGQAMIAAGLAEGRLDGVWIKGAKKRIGYLEKKEAREEAMLAGLQASAPAAATEGKPKKPKKPKATPDGYQDTVDHFFDRYTRRYEKKPTFNGKTGRLLIALIKAHGAAEVQRRIDVLFDAPPTFLSSSPPDVGTLAQHFDKLVAPAGRPQSPKGSGRFEPAENLNYEKAPWEL